MNTQSADLSAGTAPQVSVLRPATGTFTTLVTLVRREFWEHRALWRVPLVCAVLLALCAIPAHVNIDVDDMPFNGTDGESKVAVFSLSQWLISMPQYLVMVLMLSFYLLDCLYAERKDRSILFWKSLPVSDGLTVASKLLVALVVVPLGVFALALVSHLVFFGIWQARVAMGHAPALATWDTLAWLRVQIVMLLCVVLGMLWYAPVAAALLLISAWARRAPIIWATLPLLFAPILERIAFGTRHLSGFIRYRTFGIWDTLGLFHSHVFEGHRLHSLGDLLAELNFRDAFLAPGLWLGVVVAAALAYAATRVRRYRDDT